MKDETNPAIINTQALEGRFLGKQTDYKFKYDKTLLNPLPRITERNRIGLKLSDTTGTWDDLPFTGIDVWNCYEVSCLTSNGLPVVGIAKIIYPAESLFIIESKSLKLYLNSFNMEQLGEPGETDTEIRTHLQRIITTDLTEAIGMPVAVHVFRPLDRDNATVRGRDIFAGANGCSIPITVLEDHATNIFQSSEAFQYNENPALISFKNLKSTQVTRKPMLYGYMSSLLRSNCKITKQPDWGTVYIGIKANAEIDEKALLKYIISFRNENHFHEEVCETIFVRLWNKIHPMELFVGCFYTRRGGIDINPIRVSHAYMIDEYFYEYANPNKLSSKLPRQ